MSNTAYPRNIGYGTEDRSTRIVYPVPKGTPQFQPLFMLDTPKGNYEDTIVTGGELIELYGKDVFDATSKVANHQSLLAREVLGSGATAVVRRMRPLIEETGGVKRLPNIAGVVMNALIETTLSNGNKFDRDPITGKILYDANGNTMYTADTVDFRRVLIVSEALVGSPKAAVNAAVTTVTIDGTIYNKVPLFATNAEGHGVHYNNIGISVHPLLGSDTDTALKEKGIIAFEIKAFENVDGNINTIKTTMQQNTAKFAFDEYAINPLTGDGISFKDVFPSSYGNLVRPDQALQAYTFGELAVADVSLATKLLTDTEVDAFTVSPTWMDVSYDATNAAEAKALYPGLFNMFTLQNTSVARYETIRPLDINNQVIIDLKAANLTAVVSSIEAPTYLQGGEDSDYSLSEYEASIRNEMSKYMDRFSTVINTATNKDTMLIDSGFTLDTKTELLKYIGIRKDNFVQLSTYIWNKDNTPQTWSEALSMSNLLSTFAALYIESEEFGTHSHRSNIIIGSGPLSKGGYRYHVPLTFDYSKKLGKFAGAGNGRWNAVEAFSRQPKNLTEVIYDIHPIDVPPVGERLWLAGATWTEPESTVQNYYPAQQTVYDNDTSVLNSVIASIATGFAARINDSAHRTFSGATDLSDSQLITEVTNFISASLEDKFANIVEVSIRVHITDYDKILGYAWHTEVTVYADNMKTVQHSKVIAQRKGA